jgi:hypothetical protein
MKLLAISRFQWRGNTYEIGDEVLCPDPIIAKRLMDEGNVESVTKLDVPAASKPITPKTGNTDGAEIPPVKPVVAKKQVAKKKKR